MKTFILKASKFKFLGFIFLMLFVYINSCKKNISKNELAQIDNLLALNESKLLDTQYLKKIDSIRNFINKDDIKRLSEFYKIKQLHFQTSNNYTKASHYSDSLINLFKNEKIIAEHKELYFNALLLKGDAAYLSKKFSPAVLYYLEARSFRKKKLDICFNTELAVRIGNVYYVQSKFAQAAEYYKESYELRQKCSISSDSLKHFYEVQAILNNIGFCYERIQMLDSAQYFYQKDLDYIRRSSLLKSIPPYAINDASAIALDNLGSIFLKKKNLEKAKQLLLKSIAIKYSGGEGFKIPPLIKLAHLYTITGQYELAANSFDKADSLLQLKPDAEFRSKWLKYKSEYYLKNGDFRMAYSQILAHLDLKDSSLHEQAKLSSIDVKKDFESLEQRYHVLDLEKTKAAQTLYLILGACLLTLAIIIAFLLYRSAQQSKKNHEITKLYNEELKEALLKLEDANKNYVRVMKIMAHDLRNPLNGISGISSLLLTTHRLTFKESESLAIIKASADHAKGMINEILDAVLSNKDQDKMEKEDFDVRILLYQCVSLLNFKAAEKKQNIIIRPQKNKDLIIFGNKEKLWRVFNNIIVNAIKFSYEEATIELSIEKLEKSVIISFADYGIGIPEEFKNRIFDMFTDAKRLGTSDEKPYGLGLSICKQIVEAHHGEIWFEPNPAGGTIFYIKLPN